MTMAAVSSNKEGKEHSVTEVSFPFDQHTAYLTIGFVRIYRENTPS
jgi:hypothetical protein